MTVNAGEEKGLRELLDREAIRDCQMRYCHGVDRRDRELLRSVYWPEAIDDHARFVGNAYEFIDNVMARMNVIRQYSHFIGNVLIRVEGTSASVQTNFISYHCYRGSMADGGLAKEGPLVNDVLGGRYLDRMEKRAGEWRILHRKAMFDWFRAAEPAPADWEKGFMGFADRIGAAAPGDDGSKLFGDALLQGLKF